MTTANDVRNYVKANIIDLARKQGKSIISFKASDVHKALNLKDRFPLVCSSIDADKFLDFAGVTIVKRSGPKQSSSVVWTFRI